MNKKEYEEIEKRRHEYMIAEWQRGEQRIIDTFDEKTERLEKRVTSMEHWRIQVNAIVVTLGSLVGWEKIKRFF